MIGGMISLIGMIGMIAIKRRGRDQGAEIEIKIGIETGIEIETGIKIAEIGIEIIEDRR